jgi:hypothetical protein
MLIAQTIPIVANANAFYPPDICIKQEAVLSEESLCLMLKAAADGCRQPRLSCLLSYRTRLV